MRRLFTLALAASAVALLPACGLILGSFTTEGGGGSKDGGTDASGDVGDAKQPSTINCSFSGKKVIGNNPKWWEEVNAQPNARIAIHGGTGNGPSRIAVEVHDQARRLQIGEVVNGNFQPRPALEALPVGVGMSSFTSYDGGFAVVGLDFTGPKPAIMGYMVPDAQAAAGPLRPIATLPIGATNFVTALAPIDPEQGKFAVAISYEDIGDKQHHLMAGVAELKNGSGPILSIKNFPSRPNFGPGSLLVNRGGQSAVLLVGADKGNGATTALELDFVSGLKNERALQPPNKNANYLTNFAMPDSRPSGSANAVMLIEGNINDDSVPKGVRTAIVPDGEIGQFDLGTAPFVKLTASELAIDQAGPLWQFYPSSPQLVMAARQTATGKGVNFLWFDGKTGALRSKLSGTTAFAQEDDVVAASAAHVQVPTDVVATLSVVWLTKKDDMTLGTLNCLSSN